MLRKILPVLVSAAALFATAPASAEKYAIVIANSDYRVADDVKYAASDADAVTEMLVNVHGVARRNVLRLDNATLGEMRALMGGERGLGRLPGLVRGSKAELFVYFAGHGSREAAADGQSSVPYLLGVDSVPGALEETGFALDQFLGQLRRLKREAMPEGTITVFLESCFSGRSHVGDLIKDRSAPLHGAPVVLSRHLTEVSGDLVVMAAARGDQFAVWDGDHGMSVFTDALVAGMHGEADDPSYSGNGDGQVTARELRDFVDARMARRLASVQPGVVQTPDFVGLADDDVLVEGLAATPRWLTTERRKQRERLRAALLATTDDVAEIDGYLATCVYCPERDPLRARLAEIKRRDAFCADEAPLTEQLASSGTREQITAFLEVATCERGRKQLGERLAALNASASGGAAAAGQPGGSQLAAADTASSQGGENDRQIPAAAALDADAQRDLVVRLQTELQRVGCLKGRADGIWGRQGRRAMTRFLEEIEDDDAGDVEPSEELIELVAGAETGLCEPDQEAAAPSTSTPSRAARQAAPKRQTVAACASGQKRNSRGKCYTPTAPRAARATAPNRPKKASAPTRTRTATQTTPRRSAATTRAPAKKRSGLCAKAFSTVHGTGFTAQCGL